MKKKLFNRRSWLIFGLSLALSLLGLLFVFEASVAESFNTFSEPYHFVRLQALRLVFGLVALFFAKTLPIKFWQKLSPMIFFGSLIMMLLVFVPGIGVAANGARRWLQLGPERIQPVEFLKFGIVTYFADWLTRHQKFGPFLFLTVLLSGLLVLQPDVGSLLVVVGICFGMYFLSGADIKKLGLLIGGGLILGLIVVLSSTYRLKRITTYLNPELDPLGSSFHIRQITLALGNGGVFGVGIGKSKQKYAYIPEASTDSIFAIMAEEIGFLGSSVVILLLLWYLSLGFKIAHDQKPGTYSFNLASGISLWIGGQILLNLAAVVALVPLTGLPLPFFSYGGSSLIMILLSTGILMRLTRET